MQSRHLKWYLLLALALIWGSSFILIKRGLVGLNPFQLGSLRIIFCALFLLVIGFRTLPSIPRRQWKYISLTALFGTFLPVYLFSTAQLGISSSISAILNSLTPLNTLLLGALVFGLGFTRRQLLGVLIGLAGCVLLIYSGASTGNGENYFYTLFVIIASGCYAINVNLVKKYLSGLSPIAISTGNFAVMIVPAVIILLISGFANVATQPGVILSATYVMVLGVVGTGIANILFFRLIQMSSPVFASSVTYLIPVVAFGWGLIDGESLTLAQGFGAAVILVGVYFSARK
ncbi:permease [Flavobacterium cyanobacteriorum]|uniref:Permease n=1 Tax=Flavobacterium cyanobacteriorum TaxID=2022802 RepID=A0A255ZAW3_9FLAO|nr:DMT family transporter [Flavobacterium cyanobacteriorum]OYQ38572.1 permease [Flavobacterium cyanobacteriorum]